MNKINNLKRSVKLSNNDSKDIYKDINLVYDKWKLLMESWSDEEEASFINEALIYYPNDIDLIDRNRDLLIEFQRDSEEFLRGLLKVNPNNSEAYVYLGRNLSHQAYISKDESKFQEAIACLDKAIEVFNVEVYEDNLTCIYIDKGNTLLKFKKYDDAIKAFDLIDDDHYNADIKFREKAIIYRDLKKYDLALYYINKSIKMGIVDSYLMEIKGSIYVYMKEYDIAIKYLNQVNDRKDAIYYKAVALKEKGEYSKSLECLNKIEENKYFIKNGWIDHLYEKAQKLIKEINNIYN
jgi:tetratricopeptide (TPR) repeat protein